MKGQQISPWSIYHQSRAYPFKTQLKVLKKKPHDKTTLPKIHNSFDSIQLRFTRKLNAQQSIHPRNQQSKIKGLLTTINKVILQNSKQLSKTKFSKPVQQKGQTENINNQKQMVQIQMKNFVILTFLYQQLKRQALEQSQENYPKQKEDQEMIKSQSCGLQTYSNQIKSNQPFPDIKGPRIHNCTFQLSHDKIKKTLNRSITYKVSDRLKILWERKATCEQRQN